MRAITILLAVLVTACSPSNPSPADGGANTGDTGPVLTDGGTDDTGDGGSTDGGGSDPPELPADIAALEGVWCVEGTTTSCAPFTPTLTGGGDLPGGLAEGDWNTEPTSLPMTLNSVYGGCVTFTSSEEGVVEGLSFGSIFRDGDIP